MRTARHALAGWVPFVAGMLLSGFAAERCAAEQLLVRNESQGPLVISVVGVVGKSLRRERPVLLHPKDVSPAITIPGNKVLTVIDGRAPNRVVFQGVIKASAKDQFIAIVPGMPMRLEMRKSFPPP